MSKHKTMKKCTGCPKKGANRIFRELLGGQSCGPPWAILTVFVILVHFRHFKKFWPFLLATFFRIPCILQCVQPRGFYSSQSEPFPLGLRCHRVPYSGSALPEDPTRGTIWDWSILYPEQRSKAWVAGGIVSITSIILFTLMRNVFR